MPVFSGGGSIVSSANIQDGTIVNADINAAAAIAMTKMANAPWLPLDTVTLGVAGLTLNSNTFAARANLFVEIYVPSLAGAGRVSFQFNNDTANNYYLTTVENGGVGTSIGPTSILRMEDAVGAGERRQVFSVKNILAQNKIIQGSGYFRAGLVEASGEWVNTIAQVTSIQLTGTFNLAAGTTIKVWGHD